MKIRRGFVTNSSSSSFIIARKGNVDKMRLGYELLNQTALNDIVNDFMKDTDSIEYFELSQKVKNLIKNKDFDGVKKQLVKEFVDELVQRSSDMKLDDWDISIGEASNETDNILDFFIYELCSIDLEDFKIQTSFY